MRSCAISLDADFPLTRQAEACIGYLATWACHGDTDRYRGQMSIYGMAKDGELVAIYRNEAGMPTFAMHGIRGEDGTYTTHS